MAINLICPECKSNLSLRARICKNCGYYFSNGKKYRVVVKDQNGRRISKVLNSVAIARKLERKLKTQILENSLFGITKIPFIDEVWQKYLAWAKEYKKSWKDDDMRWKCHVKSHFAGKKMDGITTYDVHFVIKRMRLKRNYAPATVKHVIVLIKRVYNWAAEMDLYSGQNPASKIKLPKLNNEITECLSKDEISRLLKTLDNWVNQRAALLTKFALYTGMRRGEVFNLKWENVDDKNGWIYLSDTKGGKDSYLPISDEALKILKEARMSQNEARVKRLQEQQMSMSMDQMQSTMDQMKPMMFTMIFLVATFAFIGSFIEGIPGATFSVPWKANVDMVAQAYSGSQCCGFTNWMLLYMLVSMSFSQIIARILKWYKFTKMLENPEKYAKEEVPEEDEEGWDEADDLEGDEDDEYLEIADGEPDDEAPEDDEEDDDLEIEDEEPDHDFEIIMPAKVGD